MKKQEMLYSQDRRGKSLLLVQSLGLTQLEDLTVVQRVDFVLKQLQRRRLTGQSPCDLLPYNLHNLDREAGLDVI